MNWLWKPEKFRLDAAAEDDGGRFLDAQGQMGLRSCQTVRQPRSDPARSVVCFGFTSLLLLDYHVILDIHQSGRSKAIL